MVPAQWLLEEPLFGNPLIVFGGSSLLVCLLGQVYVNWRTCEEGRGWRAPGSGAERLGLHCVRSVERLMVGAVPISVPLTTSHNIYIYSSGNN